LNREARKTGTCYTAKLRAAEEALVVRHVAPSRRFQLTLDKRHSQPLPTTLTPCLCMAVSLLRQLLWVCRHSEHLLFSILTMLHNLTTSTQSRQTTILHPETWWRPNIQTLDLVLPAIVIAVKLTSNRTSTINSSTASPLIRILGKCHSKSRQFSPIIGHPTTLYECSKLSQPSSRRRCLTPDYPNRAGTFLFFRYLICLKFWVLRVWVWPHLKVTRWGKCYFLFEQQTSRDEYDDSSSLNRNVSDIFYTLCFNTRCFSQLAK